MKRRTLLLSAAGLPFISSCASDMTRLRNLSPDALARELGVCSAAYVPLRAGRPGEPVALSGGADTRARPDAIFQAASLTKPVVALAALRLVRTGQLELDAPVSRYLPGGYRHFHNELKRSAGDSHDLVPESTLRQISVAQLLNHSTGFPNWSSGVLSLPSDPGRRWRYSGEGYMLLQSVIEAVTRTELATYLDQQLFIPLGMHDTSLVWRDAFEARAVSGVSTFGIRLRIRMRSAAAAFSLYTTAADYARFMAALLADDAVISMTLARPVEVDEPLGLKWGLGWGIEQAPDGVNLWQWGNNPGFRAFAMASVVSKDGFVLLTNSERGMVLAASVAQAVLPGEHNAFRFHLVA
jgi:CubicO group peptidase (beta-lactamase class C family)